ncbi:MAG: spore coat associated protein CotJA [Oscillospiraceae bacterium]|nr:spore coat associated protein CotJA [Oscillospiraceae bacterium]
MESINATGFRIMSPTDETPTPGYPGDEKVLAMAYVKWQDWKETYSEEDALKNGTLFKELNLPFRGEGGGSAT